MFARKPESEEEWNAVFSDPATAQRYARKSEKTAPMMYGAFLNELAALVSSLSSPSPGSAREALHVLDVGAGPGVLTSMVAAHYPHAQITALEPSPSMIAAGEEYIKQKGLAERVRFAAGNAMSRNDLHPLGTFDLVYCVYTLHFFKQPEQAIHNLLGLLNAEGALCFFDMQRVWWLAWMPGNDTFRRSLRASYTPREVRAIFERAGISSYELKTIFPFLLSVVVRK